MILKKGFVMHDLAEIERHLVIDNHIIVPILKKIIKIRKKLNIYLSKYPKIASEKLGTFIYPHDESGRLTQLQALVGHFAVDELSLRLWHHDPDLQQYFRCENELKALDERRRYNEVQALDEHYPIDDLPVSFWHMISNPQQYLRSKRIEHSLQQIKDILHREGLPPIKGVLGMLLNHTVNELENIYQTLYLVENRLKIEALMTKEVEFDFIFGAKKAKYPKEFLFHHTFLEEATVDALNHLPQNKMD